MEILYTANEIHSRIKKIFANPSATDRRVTIVAFIGPDVKSFLPSPKNMLIICNPNPVATSVDAISYLMNNGADVWFSNSLHMKIYYSKERGCIITSANLSNNALGSGKLKEVGVFCPSQDVDIDRLIELSKRYKITKNNLIDLDIQSKKIITAMKTSNYDLPIDAPIEYVDWFFSKEVIKWKLGWYEDQNITSSKQTLDRTKSDYGKKAPKNLLNNAKNQISEADWILCFRINPKSQISLVEWMYVDFISKVSKEDKDYDSLYCYQSVQVNQLTKYPTPPFIINKTFCNAFSKALKEYGIEKIVENNSLVPPSKLLELIKLKYE